MKVDAVFEGGGVKGIGLVGAVSEVEKAGYEFEDLAGTSAGAPARLWPTFGFKLMEPNTRQRKEPSRNPITNPVSFLKAIVGTMMDAHDKYHVTKTSGDLDRTIGISTVVNINGRTREIKTTDFDITREESTALFQNGVEDGKRFLSAWDFGKWKQAYRGMVAPPAGSAWTGPGYLIIGRTRRAGGC